MKKGWERIKLGDLSEVITKGTTPTSVGYKFIDQGINFIKVESIGLNGDFLPHKFANISDKCHIKLMRSQLKKDDILFSIAGALGRTALVTKDILPANTNQALSIIRLKPSVEIEKEFILLALNSGYVFKQIQKFKGGVAQQNLSLTQVKDFIIPLPPLPEQKRIVKILDKAFTAIDKAKANAEKNLQNSKELFKSYLQNIFANPAPDWEEKKLNQISKNLDSKRIPITKSKRIRGKYPYYGASGIVDHVNDYIFDDDLLLISEDGANLFARSTPIAFSVSGKIWVNNHAHILKFNNMTTQKFVEMFFASIKLDEYITGAAQPKLNQAALNSITIPVPPIKKQKKIIKQIENISIQSKKLEDVYKQKNTNLDELKKSILQKAFNGEL